MDNQKASKNTVPATTFQFEENSRTFERKSRIFKDFSRLCEPWNKVLDELVQSVLTTITDNTE